MPKEEWGTKRMCPTTGRRFYDLNAKTVISPYTGETVNIETGKASRTMVADKPDASAKPAEEDKTEEEVVLEDDGDDNDDDGKATLGDDVLDDDDDNDDVSLDEIADVAADKEE